jgi:hypothetical protein
MNNLKSRYSVNGNWSFDFKTYNMMNKLHAFKCNSSTSVNYQSEITPKSTLTNNSK